MVRDSNTYVQLPSSFDYYTTDERVEEEVFVDTDVHSEFVSERHLGEGFCKSTEAERIGGDYLSGADALGGSSPKLLESIGVGHIVR